MKIFGLIFVALWMVGVVVGLASPVLDLVKEMRSKRNRSLAPVACGANHIGLLEFGVFMYMILSGYWVAVVVMWVLTHWER